MCSAIMKRLRFAYTQESCFDAWKRSHMGCYVVDLLIPKNRVFRLRNVQIWVVLFWKKVVLLIFSNFVSKLQNVQICSMSKCNGVYLLIVINGILAAKRSDKSSTILQECRFARFRNSVFPVRNVEIWAVLSSNNVDLLKLRNRVFSLRNVQI